MTPTTPLSNLMGPAKDGESIIAYAAWSSGEHRGHLIGIEAVSSAACQLQHGGGKRGACLIATGDFSQPAIFVEQFVAIVAT